MSQIPDLLWYTAAAMHFKTADLCDKHAGDVAIADPIFRNFGGHDRFNGPITTLKCPKDNSLVRDTLSTPGNGGILVADGEGLLNYSLLGDVLGLKAVENGWAGLVIYGCVRDSEMLKTLDLGVKALATYPLRTIKRGLGEKNIPVRFAGIDFLPGDRLYADPDGIVVSRKDLLGAPDVQSL